MRTRLPALLAALLAATLIAALCVAPTAATAHAADPEPTRTLAATIATPDGPTVLTLTVPASQVPAQLAQLRAHDAVLLATLDTPVTATGEFDADENTAWNLTSTRARAAWATVRGTGTVVAVLDTGVDATHEDLAGRVLPGWDAITDTPLPADHTDPHGHGTAAAGIIAATAGNQLGSAGVAPDTQILPVRVLNDDGSGLSSSVARGIYWAVANDADVLSLSLGGSQNTATTAAVEYAVAHGVVVVASGGNSYAEGNTPNYPAAIDEAIAVAAFDPDHQHAPFSNTGEYIDIAAPGMWVPTTSTDGTYKLFHGTSAAAPHVAAAAALILSADPALDPTTVAEILADTARDIGPGGHDNTFGSGAVDADAAVCAATRCDAPEVDPRPATLELTSKTRVTGTTTRLQGLAQTPGVPFQVTGRVLSKTTPLTGERVEVDVLIDGLAPTTHATRTDAHGRFSFDLYATRHSLVQVAHVDSGEVRTVRVRVRPRVKLTSPQPGTVRVVRVADPAQRVLLQHRHQGRWVTEKTLRFAGIDHDAFRSVRPGRWRAVAVGNAQIGRTVSATTTVRN